MPWVNDDVVDFALMVLYLTPIIADTMPHFQRIYPQLPRPLLRALHRYSTYHHTTDGDVGFTCLVTLYVAY